MTVTATTARHRSTDGGSDDCRVDVVVVGAGLAGLVAAAVAAGQGRTVIIVEPHGDGGRASGRSVDGYVFDLGPRALYRDGAAKVVLDMLGVGDLTGGVPPTDRGHASRSGRLHLLPADPASLLRTRLLGARDKVRLGRVLSRFGNLDPVQFEGLSAEGLIGELGLRGGAAALVRSVMRLATYVAGLDRLDGPTALVQTQMALTGGVSYLDGGWQTIVDALAERCLELGVDRVLGSVDRIEPSLAGPRVRTRDGAEIDARSVIVACGNPLVTDRLLPSHEPWSLGPPARAACLALGLRRVPTCTLVLGMDEPLYLSRHDPPARLAPEGGSVVHVMRYLAPSDDTPSDATKARLFDLARISGIADDDVVAHRFYARMVVTGAIPTPERGLRGRPTVDSPARPGVFLAGDWVGDVGLLADAAAASAEQAGRAAAEHAARLRAV